MKSYAVILSEEEEKALLTDMISVQTWLDNAIHNRARQCIDAIVEQYSDKQAKKLPEAEKLKIVKDAKVQTALERNKEFEDKLKEQK